MQPWTKVDEKRTSIVVIGGNGGLFARYRDLVERSGYQFSGFENHVPVGRGPSAAKIALVIVMVTMVSHPLLERARALAGDPTRIVYLRSPSISALRQTLLAVAQA